MTTLIPKDAIIAEEKIRDYLLVPQEKGDKSKFLALAGYSKANHWELLRDIREPLLPGEAEFQEHRHNEDVYRLPGILRGPNGVRLAVRTIWAVNFFQEIRFITLLPDNNRYRNEIRTL
ncbi:MAG TPA: hypothetical protein VFH95_04135 [Candidatus Kapabacteria bacterium]|nr:hypothetical protein [Candidatus Kapabacteria bacterium]